jgi:small GTP-binding protein
MADHHNNNAAAAASQGPRPLQMGAKGAYIVRLLMVGDSACGKTSLVLRFDQNVFSTKFVTTIGVDYRDKMVKVRVGFRIGTRARTGSQSLRCGRKNDRKSCCNEMPCMEMKEILMTDWICLLCPCLQIEGAPMRLQLWDTAGQERFRSLTSNFFGRADGFVLTYDISNRPSFDHVIGWMRDIKTRAPPDCDIVLCGNKCDLDNDRVVTPEEGQQLADEYGVQFFETSALTGSNVEIMFTALATTIKHKRIDEFDGAALATAMANGGSAANGHISAAPSADNADKTISLSAATDPKRAGTKASSTCC